MKLDLRALETSMSLRSFRAPWSLPLVLATALFGSGGGSGCAKDAASASPVPSSETHAASQTGPEAPLAKAAAHLSGEHYKVDTTSTCAGGGDCTGAIRLEALGDYHLNVDYPYKFKATSESGVTFKGTAADSPNVFSKTSGDFAKQSEKVGVLTVKLAATKPTTVTGKFKMSVCSAANCELEELAVAIDVAP